MPLYMDVHHKLPEGAGLKDVADAHMKDLEVQGKHGKVFCLVEAPNPEAAHAVHREAHGLVADEIFEVSEGS